MAKAMLTAVGGVVANKAAAGRMDGRQDRCGQSKEIVDSREGGTIYGRPQACHCGK